MGNPVEERDNKQMSWNAEYVKEQIRKAGYAPILVALGLGIVIGIILGLPLSQVVDFDEVPGIGEIGCMKVVVRYDPGVREYTPKIEIFDAGQGVHFEKKFATRTSQSSSPRTLEWIFHDIPAGTYKATASAKGGAFPDWTCPEAVQVRAYPHDDPCACVYFDYIENRCGQCVPPNPMP